MSPYARSRGRGALSHHGSCLNPTAVPQYTRITRYVKSIGYGPVPHITLHTQNAGAVA